MRKTREFIIAALAVLLITACNAHILTTPPSDYEGSSGRPFTKAFFTGSAPSGVIATQAFYTDKVSLMFNVVPGADFYEIYKAAVPRDVEDIDINSLDWKKLDHDVEPKNASDRTIIWDDEIPESDRAVYRYFYKVRAGSNIDYANGVKDGSFSEIVEGWTLIPPTTLEVTQGEFIDKITLTWKGNDHVQGYLIYLFDADKGEWVIVPDGFFAAPPKGVETFTYDYKITDESDYGKTLYFKLGSVSLGNKPSAMGISRSGYTFVKGAPQAPKNLSVSQADYTDRIKISWEKPTDDKRKPGFNWVITRFTDNSPEEPVVAFNAYDIENPDKIPEGLEIVDIGGKQHYVFTDTMKNGLKAGNVYHYKVMAFAEIEKEGEKIWAPGKATIQDGSLLAPPRGISINVSFPEDAPDGRFTFTIPTPYGYMGVDETEHTKGWTYSLYGRYNDGLDTPEAYRVLVEDVPVEETSTVMTYDFSVMSKKNEFAVVIKNKDGAVSKNTDELYKMILSADRVFVDDIVFKSNGYRSGLTANSNGVYPVFLDINNPDAFKKLYISVNGSVANEISIEKLKKESFAIESPQMPFETYEYTVYGESLFGRKTKVSKPVVAYGAVTPEKFIKLFEAYAMKPWEFVGKAGFPANLNSKWTSGNPGKLHSMIDSHGLDALGSMTISGDYHGGSLSYSSVKGDGFAGNVYFSFKNFGELEGIWSNGSYEMINVSTSGNGNIVNGTVKVDGMYPAVVDFSHLSVSGYGFDGSYRVIFNNELGEQTVKATKN